MKSEIITIGMKKRICFIYISHNTHSLHLLIIVGQLYAVRPGFAFVSSLHHSDSMLRLSV